MSIRITDSNVHPAAGNGYAQLLQRYYNGRIVWNSDAVRTLRVLFVETGGDINDVVISRRLALRR